MTASTLSLEAEYFGWLCQQIKPRRPSRTYTMLFELLWTTEFIWFIPNDDNRIEDGVELFAEYFHLKGLDVKIDREPGRGCSVLELVISLSRRLAWNAGGEQEEWAWTLIENLGLGSMSGHITANKLAQAQEKLDTFIWRHYESNGVGGLFPLQRPTEDQTKVEIWYQMHAYIEENNPL